MLVYYLRAGLCASENRADWQHTPTHTHQWVDLCLIEVAYSTITPSNGERHSCAAPVYSYRGYLWSPWGSIHQESPYAAYCMPVGRWGHGAYVFRWCNLCWSSCEKASAIHVWAGNQGRQACEKKLMRWTLLSMPTRRSTQCHMSASRHFLTWVALRESSWTFALALLNRGSKLMLQHGGKRVLTKQWNGSSCLPACLLYETERREVLKLIIF